MLLHSSSREQLHFERNSVANESSNARARWEVISSPLIVPIVLIVDPEKMIKMNKMST